MPSTQRIPLVLSSPARRTARIDLMRAVRHLELECRTRDEVEGVADIIAALLPEPMLGRLGIIELLLNAIEHGNLEIGRALKGELLRELRFADEVAARLARAPYRQRRVRVRARTAYPVVEIEIHDDGPGFDWRGALAAGITDDGAPNGRGVALVRRVCFPMLTYRDPGNVAIVRAEWPQ